MPSLAEYFEKNRYKPKFEFMARVSGLHNKIRWVGSVGNDTVISEAEGPVLHILLDLPLKINGIYQYILVTKYTTVKRLIEIK